jgi:hypothetical protein
MAAIPSCPIIVALFRRFAPVAVRCGDEAIPPIGAILSTAPTVDSLARSGCQPLTQVGSFARFPDPSAALLGSFRRFRRLNGARWVRFATAAGPSFAAVSRHFGRSWVRYAISKVVQPRLGCQYGSIGFVSRRRSRP